MSSRGKDCSGDNMRGSRLAKDLQGDEVVRDAPIILGIHGSPRGMKSRTRKLLRWVLDGAENAGAQTNLVDLSDLHIEACTGCGYCSISGECVFHDDFRGLYAQMLTTDGIVLGSPVYIDHVTGQMKIFIDRLADAVHYQVLTGRYGCAVSTTWSSGGETVVAYLNHVLNYLGALAVPGLHVELEDDATAIYRAEGAAMVLGKELVEAIHSRRHFPGQESFIQENRAFFGAIVEENREWRPEAYDEWVQRGWIR